MRQSPPVLLFRQDFRFNHFNSMRPKLLFPVVGAAFSGICAALGAELPLSFDFNNKAFKVGALDGQQGWKTEQGEVYIREAEGLRHLSIPAQELHGQASVYFPKPVPGKPVFIDLKVRLGAAKGAAEFVDANGSLTTLVRVDATGRLLAGHEEANGVTEWLDTQVKVPLDEAGFMKNWTRLTIRQDAGDKTWDLYVDGVMKAGNFGLLPDEREEGGYFTLLGDTLHEVQLQALAIAQTNMLFVDADGDGLPDPWQASLSKRGRDDDPDGTV